MLLNETCLNSQLYGMSQSLRVNFIFSEKATNFCKTSTIDLSYVVTVKSMVEISQNVLAFSEYMNFTTGGQAILGHYYCTKPNMFE